MIQKLEILRFDAASPYIRDVVMHTDGNKRSFGFITPSAYQESIAKGNLWILAYERKYVGHLLLGGKYPVIKIFQLYISNSYKNRGYGRFLVDKLIQYAKSEYYQSISAKVAAELPAIKFWEKVGFKLIDQESGRGNTRLINRYAVDIDENTLFEIGIKGEINQLSELIAKNTPLSHIPIYTIDLNVLFDYIKKRKNELFVAHLISMAMAGHIRIVVTKEFSNELQRNSSGEDPVLRFAETISTLPELNQKQNKAIINELYTLIFPDTKESQKINDKSDIIHIASSIVNEVDGFITSEKKILRHSHTIRKKYGIEVLSPYELFSENTGFEDLSVLSGENEIFISRIDIPINIKTILDSFQGILSNRAQTEIRWSNFNTFYQISISDTPIGCLGIQIIQKTHQKINAVLVIDENAPEIFHIADSCLNLLFETTLNRDFSQINLKIIKDASVIAGILKERGFLKTDDTGHAFAEYTKIWINKVITKKVWTSVIEFFKDSIGFEINPLFPNYNEIASGGIILHYNAEKYRIKLFDFEQYFSPSILLCKGRPGVIVPIQKNYSEAFFPQKKSQGELFADKIASVSFEKVYFKAPRQQKCNSRGMLAFFYESGKDGGSKTIIGYGRITSSQIVQTDNISDRFYRQGVLSTDGVRQRSKNNKIHVITFSNFSLFTTPIPYSKLKEKNLISKANLVTTEEISCDSVEEIFKLGLNGD